MVYSALRENTALLLREKMPSCTPALPSKSVPLPLSNEV